jgi:hypothetical protein
MIKALLDAGQLSEREALDHARVERALAAGGESESAARSDQCPLLPTLSDSRRTSPEVREVP